LLADTHSGHDETFIMTDKGNVLSRKWSAALARGEKGAIKRAATCWIRKSLDKTAVVVGYAESRPDRFADLKQFKGFDWHALVVQPESAAFSALDWLSVAKGQLARTKETSFWVIFGVLTISLLGSVVAISMLYGTADCGAHR
jgi:hypothetical protein